VDFNTRVWFVRRKKRLAEAPSFASTKAVAFDGVDGFGSADKAVMPGGTEASVYMRFRHAYTGATGSRKYIINGSSSAPRLYLAFFESNGNLLAFNSTANNYTFFARPTEDIWHTLLWTYDQSSGHRAWIDGVAQTPISPTGSPGAYGAGTTQDVSISSQNSASYANGATVDIAELAFWTTQQSAIQADLYNGGVPPDLTPFAPVAWYRMGDGPDDTNTLIQDLAGSASMTLTNVSAGEIIDL